MVVHGGSSAGSYLADPKSPIPSHCAVIILIKSVPSASIAVTSTLRVKFKYYIHSSTNGSGTAFLSWYWVGSELVVSKFYTTGFYESLWWLQQVSQGHQMCCHKPGIGVQTLVRLNLRVSGPFVSVELKPNTTVIKGVKAISSTNKSWKLNLQPWCLPTFRYPWGSPGYSAAALCFCRLPTSVWGCWGRVWRTRDEVVMEVMIGSSLWWGNWTVRHRCCSLLALATWT